MRIVVTLSGGKASAYCAFWALSEFYKSDVVLYFNDTKWEHPDLYRFLKDLQKYFRHKITIDADGRSPEQLFYDERALANNRMPFCSRILKAKRLQNWFQDNDMLVFGIGNDEIERAKRLTQVYQKIMVTKRKRPVLRFPLIEENITNDEIDAWLKRSNIEMPELYKLGFKHNNCSGGCVRAGKKQWKMLFEKLPEVYFERERVEDEIRKFLKKDVHIFKDETLKSFRKRIIAGDLSSIYDEDQDDGPVECFGICETMA